VSQIITPDLDNHSIAVLESLDDGGQTQRILWPGSFGENGWVATDISGETPDVQAVCATAWTPGAVDEYKSTVQQRYESMVAAYNAHMEAQNKLLPRWRFDAQLEISGLGTSLNTVIDTMTDITKRAIIRARLQTADPLNRDDASFSDPDLLTAMHMTSSQIDDLWAAAWALPDLSGNS
jgi:hypothetical protein